MAQHRVRNWIACGAVLLTLAAAPAAIAAPSEVRSSIVAESPSSIPLITMGEPTAGQIVQSLRIAIEWLWQSMLAAPAPNSTGAAAAPASDPPITPPQPYAFGGDDASGPWPKL
jgi:hypothetical protein